VQTQKYIARKIFWSSLSSNTHPKQEYNQNKRTKACKQTSCNNKNRKVRTTKRTTSERAAAPPCLPASLLRVLAVGGLPPSDSYHRWRFYPLASLPPILAIQAKEANRSHWILSVHRLLIVWLQPHRVPRGLEQCCAVTWIFKEFLQIFQSQRTIRLLYSLKIIRIKELSVPVISKTLKNLQFSSTILNSQPWF
jgi:hypothetical protein